MLKRLNNIYLFLFPILILLFFPTKQLISIISIPEIILILFCILSLAVNFGRKLLKVTIIHILIFGILAGSFISLLINYEDVENIKYFLRNVEYFAVFCLFYGLTSTDNAAIIRNSFIWCTVIVCLYAFLQYLYPQIILINNWGPEWKAKYVGGSSMRVFSLLDNPLNLAGFLALLIGIVQKERVRFTFLILFMAYIVLILTAAKISIFVIVLSILILFAKLNWRYLNVKKLLVVVVILIVVIAGLSQINYKSLFLYGRITDKEMTYGSVNQRVLLIETSGKMISDNPAFGIGAGNFEKYYNESYSDHRLHMESSSYTAENIFLDYYLDNGLLPLLFFIMVLMNALRIGFISKGKLQKGIAVSVFLFICVGMVTNLRVVPVNMLLYMIIGIQLKLYNQETAI